MDFILFIVIIIITACSSPKQQNTEGFYVIDLEQCFNSKQQLLISEIADTLEYIILKTPQDVVVADIRSVVPFGDYMFVISKGNLYKFLRDGSFVKKIGSQGRGPGEYTSARSVNIDKYRGEIIISDLNQILFYSMEGIFLRSQMLRSFSFTISDSVIWSANYPGFWQEFQAISYSTSADTISFIRNRGFDRTKIAGGFNVVTSKIVAPFYSHKGSIFYKGFEDNDTIWTISGSVAKPHAYINMGRYKLPYEYAPGTRSYTEHSSDYLGIPLIFEDDNFFFFKTENRGSSESKYLAYDKNKRNGFIIKDEKNMGLTDDLLGGPNIRLLWSSDDYFISIYEGLELLEDIELGRHSPVPAFQEQLSTITGDTNQLIVLCQKK